MTTELTLLALLIVLGLVHAQSTGILTTIQHGSAYALGPRDERRALTGVGGRVERAFANYMQSFAFFAAAVLVAHAAGRHNGLTVTGSWFYFLARLAYVPIYASGTSGIRTAVFVVGNLGIVLVLLGLIL